MRCLPSWAGESGTPGGDTDWRWTSASSCCFSLADTLMCTANSQHHISLLFCHLLHTKNSCILFLRIYMCRHYGGARTVGGRARAVARLLGRTHQGRAAPHRTDSEAALPERPRSPWNGARCCAAPLPLSGRCGRRGSGCGGLCPSRPGARARAVAPASLERWIDTGIFFLFFLFNYLRCIVMRFWSVCRAMRRLLTFDDGVGVARRCVCVCVSFFLFFEPRAFGEC